METRQMHQAFVKCVTGLTFIVINNDLRHHHIFQDNALFARFYLQFLLNAIEDHISLVIRENTEFFIVVHVSHELLWLLYRVVVGLPQGVKRTLLVIVVFPYLFPCWNDVVILLIELSVLWKHLIGFQNSHDCWLSLGF